MAPILKIEKNQANIKKIFIHRLIKKELNPALSRGLSEL